MTELAVYILTALAGLVVLLTRARLRSSSRFRGVHTISRRLGTMHFVLGVLALTVWVVFLIAPADTSAGGALIGVLGLGLWWITAVLGMLILLRWLPARGKHAPQSHAGSWLGGPGLSLLGQVGLCLGVGFFTFAYLTQVI